MTPPGTATKKQREDMARLLEEQMRETSCWPTKSVEAGGAERLEAEDSLHRSRATAEEARKESPRRGGARGRATKRRRNAEAAPGRDELWLRGSKGAHCEGAGGLPGLEAERDEDCRRRSVSAEKRARQGKREELRREKDEGGDGARGHHRMSWRRGPESSLAEGRG